MSNLGVKVGDYAVVEVYAPKYLLPILFPDQPSTEVYQGEVLNSEPYDPKDTFRLTGDKLMPVRVIAWKNVVSVNGEPLNPSPLEKPRAAFQTVVRGSKGTEYLVEIESNGVGKCTCSGYGFRGHCSHIETAKQSKEYTK